MREQPTCEFIVLAYASDPAKEDLLPVAIAARELGGGIASGLILHVSAFLPMVIRPAHLNYLHDLFDDWRSVKGDHLDSLFSEIRGLSSGPIRTFSTGFCTQDDLSGLAARFLATPELCKDSGRTRES